MLLVLSTVAEAQRNTPGMSAETPEGVFSTGYLQSPKAYAIKSVDFNSTGMDFSPFPYRHGIVFVSARPKKGNRHEGEAAFLSLFYTRESEDGTFSAPRRLDEAVVSSYHEGPAIFFDSGTQRILTRNSFLKRRQAKDGSVNILELAHAVQLPSGKWSEPVSLPLAPEFSVAHPAISSDGTTLYFSSDMPGSLGESDIFVSNFTDGKWSAPRNAGAKINTPGQELFPSLYNDSILFFASNGHGGLGGLDLFYYNLRDADPGVIHIGEPLNSEGDDFALYMEEGGASGFFSSNRSGGFGADDIYYFEEIHRFVDLLVLDSLHGTAIGQATITLQGGRDIAAQTKSDLTGKAQFRVSRQREYTVSVVAPGYVPMEMELNPAFWPGDQKASIKIYLRSLKQETVKRSYRAFQPQQRRNLSNVIAFSSSPLDVDLAAETAEEVLRTASPADADSLALPVVKVIAVEIVNDIPAIIVEKNDTIHELEVVSGSQLASSEMNVTIDVPRGAKRHDYEEMIREQMAAQGYGVGRFLLIRSFFFDSGKTWVRNDACAQLDKIIEVMYAHPNFDLQMTFHSDSRGTDSFNLDLSQARAEEVTAYLVNAGIKRERINSSFVGERSLLNDCGDLADCDELLHQINRTAEFRFIIR